MGLERRDRAVHGQHEVNPAGVQPRGGGAAGETGAEGEVV